MNKINSNKKWHIHSINIKPFINIKHDDVLSKINN